MSKLYRELIKQLDRGKAIALETVINGAEGDLQKDMHRCFAEVSPITDAKGRRFAAVTAKAEGEGLRICEPILPQERLIVLGAGHIALPVCEFAAKSGFSVVVCDDRPDFANLHRFPDAEEVICDSFPNAIKRTRITPYDYVVVITRGHRHDADCLRMIFQGTQPAYLGLIGSRRRVKGLFEMLTEEGFDRALLDRICTPIGLKIGAVTPGEIAISILAEVVAYKRLPEHSNDGIRCCNDSDVELSTLRYLAENDDPKAIVTIIETKGSTPREAGAKMAVSPLGKVTGSIGGGCSEGAVIRDAVNIIGTGEFKLIDIDLTGDVAESDGMVCGGIMKVLVEDGEEDRD